MAACGHISDIAVRFKSGDVFTTLIYAEVAKEPIWVPRAVRWSEKIIAARTQAATGAGMGAGGEYFFAKDGAFAMT